MVLQACSELAFVIPEELFLIYSLDSALLSAVGAFHDV